MDVYYENKVKLLLEEKKQACLKRALDAAKIDVDSMIAARFNADILDSINFPIKPLKPSTPDHIIDRVDKFDIDTTN